MILRYPKTIIFTSSLSLSSILPFTLLSNSQEKSLQDLNLNTLKVGNQNNSEEGKEVKRDGECKKSEFQKIDLQQVPYNAPFLTSLHCFKENQYNGKIGIPSELLRGESLDNFRLTTYTDLNGKYKVKIFLDQNNQTLLAELILKDLKFNLNEQNLPKDIRKNEIFGNLFDYEILEIKDSTNNKNLAINLKNSKVGVFI